MNRSDHQKNGSRPGGRTAVSQREKEVSAKVRHTVNAAAYYEAESYEIQQTVEKLQMRSHIIKKECETVPDLRQAGYRLEFCVDDILPFEEKVLASGLCDFALPMSFASDGRRRYVTYDCSGYMSLADMKLSGAKQIFEMIEKTLITYNKTDEFLIDADKMLLARNTVYYHMKYRNVRLAYIPSGTKRLDNILRFISELACGADAETQRYLARVYRLAETGNRSTEDIISMTGLIRRDAF